MSFPIGARYWTYIDKTTWGPGRWRSEVDKLDWIDQESGLRCLIVRNANYGNLCGYVAVEPPHLLYGRHVDDVPSLEVHGGITWADNFVQDQPEAEPPGVEDVWWFGFACSNAGLKDLDPAMTHFADAPEGYVYRNIGYTQRECFRLARQLALAIPSGDVR